MRSVQSQIAWCIRAQWTLTIVMVSLLACFIAFGYRPTNQRRTALREEINVKVGQLETNQARAQNLPGLAFDVERLRLKLDKVNKKLPKTPGLAEFINDTAQVSSAYGIRKLMHQQGMMRRQDLYGEIPIVMSFEGDFTNVFGFVRQLEEMQRLARVKQMTVKCKDGKAGQVDVSLTMNIYFSEL